VLILDFRTSDFDAVSLSSKEMYVILQESHRKVMKPINVEIIMGHDIGISETFKLPDNSSEIVDEMEKFQKKVVNDVQ
jgi:hypothetical protein